MLKRLLTGIYCWTISHIYIFFFRKYDKKYFSGSDFQGRLNGLFSPGYRYTVRDAIGCKKQKVNMDVNWPVNPQTVVVGSQNISFDPEDLRIFQVPGCYYQGIGKITIGKGCYIAPNVGIITANHDLADYTKHSPAKPVTIGNNCWIGMNSVILPGVELGDHTVVGAGSVVTKSFLEGNCVVGGNPARKLKDL